MASLGPKNGSAIAKKLVRRTRSASFSSESSPGGGAPLHTSISEMSLKTTPKHSLSDTMATPAPKQTDTLSSSSTNLADNNIRHIAAFQIGKPPQDDEEVFNAEDDEDISNAQADMARHMRAGPVPIVDQSSTSSAHVMIPVADQSQLSPSERRHLVQGVDAQTYYPPEACVFVANLPESKSDMVLEVGITKVFSSFGPVFVKIRRDQKNMPFAFCQFTNSKHAEKAQKEAKGVLIEGRACRTEMVKANRSYVMFSRKGHRIECSEARPILASFGRIDRLEPLAPEAAKIMNLPSGVYVEYKDFDPTRDIVSVYRYNDEFCIVAYDLKRAAQPRVHNSGTSYLMRYEVDRRSVYVGNLPSQVKNIEEVLHHAASAAGTVQNMQIITKPPRNEGGRPTMFAFVEYARPDEALAAVDLLRGTLIVGNRIRVEKKSVRDPGSQPRAVPALPVGGVEQTSVSAKSGNDAIKATPARHTQPGPIPTEPVALSGGRDIQQETGQSQTPLVLPDYLPQNILRHSRSFATPGSYQRSYDSPGYQQRSHGTPASYMANQHMGTPHQGHPQQSQYVSPAYAMTPAYHHGGRNFSHGMGPYNPATPPVAYNPYGGSDGGMMYPQPTPEGFWATPFLQDDNAAYQGYGGPGFSHHRTPMHPAARSVSMMNAGPAPTRLFQQTPEHVEQVPEQAQQQAVHGGEQSGGNVGGDATGENK